MNSQQSFFTESKEALKKYLDDRILLLKLQSVDSGSRIVAAIFSGVLLAILSLFIIIFLSITLGYLFAELTGSFFWGFAIVTGIYILLFILVLILRKPVLEKSVIKIMVKAFLTDKNNQPNEQNHK